MFGLFLQIDGQQAALQPHLGRFPSNCAGQQKGLHFGVAVKSTKYNLKFISKQTHNQKSGKKILIYQDKAEAVFLGAIGGPPRRLPDSNLFQFF